MGQKMKMGLMVILGWVCVVLGLIGVVIPVLPTTPFLILALGIFAKSSPRFHQMLLDNQYVGDGLRQWEKTKTIEKRMKHRALSVIVISFGLSIMLLEGHLALQLILLVMGGVVFRIVSRLPEPDPFGKQSD